MISVTCPKCNKQTSVKSYRSIVKKKAICTHCNCSIQFKKDTIKTYLTEVLIEATGSILLLTILIGLPLLLPDISSISFNSSVVIALILDGFVLIIFDYLLRKYRLSSQLVGI